MSMDDMNIGGGGMNDGLWLFAILALLGFGGLGGNGRGSEQYATTADVQRSTDFAALERQNNEIQQNTNDVGATVTSAIKDGNFNLLGEMRDIQSAVSAGFANQQTCCCETNRNIDSVKYDMANYTAATQAAIHAEGESTRAMIQQNKIEALQSQINQLQLAQATAGVVRYPSASTYYAGANPFCASGGYSNI